MDAAHPIAANPAYVAGEVARHTVHGTAQVQGTPIWMVSFTDLCSLMLCFFLLIYAMKEPDNNKLAEMLGYPGSGGMQAGAGHADGAGDRRGAGINQIAYGAGLNLDYLHGVLKATLEQAGLQGRVDIGHGPDYLNLAVKGAVFDGDALGGEGADIARALGQRLDYLANRISLSVVPTQEGAQAGAWDSALMQAQAFAQAMRAGGYRREFAVTAQGGGRAPGVEIHVEADDGRRR